MSDLSRELRNARAKVLERAPPLLAKGPRARGFAHLLVASLALVAIACGSEERSAAEATEERKPPAYEETFTGGPVSLSIRLDTLDLPLDGRVEFEQELLVEPGFRADLPEYLPEDFGGFAVVDIETRRLSSPDSGTADSETADSGTADSATEGASDASAASENAATDADGLTGRRLRRLTLEPERTGELVLAPLEVWFHREGEAEEQSFQTAEIRLEVRPVELDDLAVSDAEDIFTTPPTVEGSQLGWWIAGGGALALALLALVFWLRRDRPEKLPPPVPAHEKAWERLRQLVSLGLVEKGEIERFYVYLSGILRSYIEDRFGVHAPERTTEEFLLEAERAPELAPYRQRLREFLDLSDRVKFAAFEPDEATVQGSFDTLKQFIEETTPRGPDAQEGSP